MTLPHRRAPLRLTALVSLIAATLGGCHPSNRDKSERGNDASAPLPSASPAGSSSATPAPAASAASGDRPLPVAHSLDGRMTATVHKMAGKEDQIFLTIDGKDELLLDLNHFDLDAARSNHPRKSPLPGYHDPYGFDPEIRAQMGAVYDLAFSPSGAVVYFLTNAWGTGSGIFAIDRGGGKPWYVRASNALYVIETCSDSALVGKLMAVPTHQFYHDMDLLQTTVLVDDQGNTLGVVGNEAGFIYRRCGVGSADPSTDERAPEPFQKPRFRCGDTTVRHYALERLDGTIEDIFRLGDNRWTSSLADLLEITNGCPKKTY